MANNRLWAVCKDDNEVEIITKYYAPEWDLPEDVGGINKFLKAHAECSSNRGCGENILFITEVEDPRVKLYDYTRSEENGGRIKIFLKEIADNTNNLEKEL